MGEDFRVKFSSAVFSTNSGLEGYSHKVICLVMITVHGYISMCVKKSLTETFR